MAIARIDVELAERSYPICLGPRLADVFSAAAETFNAAHEIVAIADRTAWKFHGAGVIDAISRLGLLPPPLFTIRAQERAKTLAVARQIWRRLLDSGAGRDTLLLAVGGGLTGDLAGFAAACYQRGIPFVQIPTTLLAQVDAAIGGKVGVNEGGFKNAIGAFHQPRAVLAAEETLSTLKPASWRCGLGEIVKYALLGQPWMLAELEANEPVSSSAAPRLAHVIQACCRHKAAIVADDERESGARASLNLGHTLGHALESVFALAKLHHGEAVMYGLIYAAETARLLGLLESPLHLRLAQLARTLRFPTLPYLPQWELIARAMRADKKRRAGRIRMVLPRDTFIPELAVDVPDDALKAAYDAWSSTMRSVGLLL